MRRGGIFAILAVALAGCAGDPGALGITGPYPNGVQSVTLNQARARADVRSDEPGIGGEPLGHYHYVPALGPRSETGSTGQRYYGYNY